MSYPTFCPVHTKHFVFMGRYVKQRSLTARKQYQQRIGGYIYLFTWLLKTAKPTQTLELLSNLADLSNSVLHTPSSVPQFHKVVKGTWDQLVLMCRRPLHGGDPAGVGGQRQQHQGPVWRWEEASVAKKREMQQSNCDGWDTVCTFGARVPQPDVSVGAAWRQPSTQWWVGNAVKDFAACL